MVSGFMYEVVFLAKDEIAHILFDNFRVRTDKGLHGLRWQQKYRDLLHDGKFLNLSEFEGMNE
jgi:hypothetical protein